MRKLKYGLLGGAAALAVAVALPMTASAWGGKGHHGGKMFEMLDTDKDGAITAAEFGAHAEGRFAKMDADGDGDVTKAAMSAARAAMRTKWRERRAGTAEERFAAMDADGDGKVTLQEMKDAVASRMAEHKKDGAEKRGERHAERIEKHFNAMDADGDGALTLEEMQSAKNRPHRGERAEGKPEGRSVATASPVSTPMAMAASRRKSSWPAARRCSNAWTRTMTARSSATKCAAVMARSRIE